MTPERIEIIAEEIVRDKYETMVQNITSFESAIERSFPRILGAMFSKKKPKDKPKIPTYDELKARNFSTHSSTIYDAAEEDNTFEDAAWWTTPPQPGEISAASSEIAYGGDLALAGLAPTSFDDITDEDIEGLDQWHKT